MSSTAAIILCGGRGDRWNDHMGITKHMVPIRGERLIVRTCRQLRARLGVEPLVVASDPRIVGLGLRTLTEYDRRCCAAGALSTLPFWADRTIILFGDTYYDKATMDGICGTTGLRAFWTDCQFLGYHWDHAADRLRIEDALSRTVQAFETSAHPDSHRGMGYLNYSYYLLLGWPVKENMVDGNHVKVAPLAEDAKGVCMDFDYPVEYSTFQRRYRKLDDLP
jgi:hypothetical protein